MWQVSLSWCVGSDRLQLRCLPQITREAAIIAQVTGAGMVGNGWKDVMANDGTVKRPCCKVINVLDAGHVLQRDQSLRVCLGCLYLVFVCRHHLEVGRDLWCRQHCGAVARQPRQQG